MTEMVQYKPANNTWLRRKDFEHFRAMRAGSELLRDRLYDALGIAPNAPKPVVLKVPEVPAHFCTAVDIIADIASSMGVTVADIMGRSREREVADARNLVFAVMTGRGSSTPRVGQMVGGRHRTTVISGVAAFEKRATPYMRRVAAKWLQASQERAA
jgi:Bacterial dnaA protein helix-turn-helix